MGLRFLYKELSKEIFFEANLILSKELEVAVEIIRNNKAAVDILVSRLKKDKCLTAESIDEALNNIELNF